MMAHLKIKTGKIWAGLLAVCWLSACYYDVEEILYPEGECITTNMSLTADIIPILERNCYICHSAALHTGSITLEGYDKLIQNVNSGRLAGAIQHKQGYSPMPKNAPKLRVCDIAKIEQWIADGALNN